MSGSAPCGTRAAYHRHRAHGQDPCGPCKAAHNGYQKAHGRAKTRLARAYPTAFASYLTEELAKEGLA